MTDKTICAETGKVSYSKKEALTIKNNMAKERKSRVKMKPKRIYQCDFCNYWHITSRPH